jgi:hypothetical protein
MIDLTGIGWKLLRADAHREELQSAIDGFLFSNPYQFITDFDRAASAYVIRARVREEPPATLGVIVGDIVHNIRSALDHLACQFVLHSAGTPTRQTAFPMFIEKPETGSRAARTWDNMTAGMNSDATEFLDHFQPYKTVSSGFPHHLALLNTLSNWDKHHDIHVVGHAFDGLEVIGTGNMHFGYVEMPPFTGLKGGAEVGRFLIDPKKPGGTMHVEIRGAFSMAFDNPETPIINGLEITRLLLSISQFVSLDIVLAVANNFPTIG